MKHLLPTCTALPYEYKPASSSHDTHTRVVFADPETGSDGEQKWLVSEIFPQENGVHLGIFERDALVTMSVRGSSARVLKVQPWSDAMVATTPLAFNVSYETIAQVNSDMNAGASRRATESLG